MSSEYNVLNGDDREIPVYAELSYSDFLDKHLVPNTPFLLSSYSTAHWPARKDWVHHDEGGGTPNLDGDDGLKRYKDHVVPVADTLQPEFSEFQRSDRPLGEILDLWLKGEGKGLYVKDWHLFAEVESAGEIYQVPECFRDDWLNPPCNPGPRPRATCDRDRNRNRDASTSTSDFRFTYLGPAGTYTPLHRDVYSSYSWSANVAGRKLWWLFPPTEQVWSRILRNGEPVFDVRELPGEGGGIKIVQQPGEIIWVPSGWYHQVVNLDFCISINHNFFSSPTLPRIYDALSISQKRVEDSIVDVKEMIIQRLGSGPDSGWEKEWVEEVQALLERDAGWGWAGFWDCIKRNLLEPPLPLPSARATARQNVREVIKRYKTRRDHDLLDGSRQIVSEVESLLDV